MEKRGQVNCYEPYGWFGGDKADIYTTNLAAGVTPFMRVFNGKEYNSLCYRLRKPVLVTVTHGFYRPKKEEFDHLEYSLKEHVLNGGLLCAELSLAVLRQLETDNVDPEWDYERFQQWCVKTYGRRLGEKPDGFPQGR